MKLFYIFSALIALSGGNAFATKNNALLAYTMKAVSKDLVLAVDPIKKPLADVSDNLILTAIIRTRTVHGLLQTAIDRRDGELIPGKIDETSDTEEKKKLSEQYAILLASAQAQLRVMETSYFKELAKDPASRDFSIAKNALTSLEAVIGQAHSMFKPPKP